MPLFNTMADVKRANADAGHHWFSPGTLRFFGSRVGHTLYGGRYFVSSERRDETEPRRYTVRVVNDAGHVDTVGDFQAYATSAAAIAAIKRLLA